MVGQWICLVLLVAVLGIASTHAHEVKLKEHCRRKRHLHSCNTCGQSNGYQFSNMIVNGQTVMPRNKYPWMVALVKASNGAKHCGGAILNEYHILTAAHCIKRPGGKLQEMDRSTCVFPNGHRKSCFFHPSEIRIAMLSDSDDLIPGPPIAMMIPHPNFNVNVKMRSDIALIRLAHPIACGPYASPICLPTFSYEPIHTGGIVGISGWGASMEPGTEGYTRDLRETRLEVVNKFKCSIVQGFPTDESSFCLWGGGISGPCFGDSGGSMFQNIEQRYFSMGVASVQSSVTCETNGLAIYTSVKAFLPWILQMIGASPMYGRSYNLSSKTKSSNVTRPKRRKHRRRGKKTI